DCGRLVGRGAGRNLRGVARGGGLAGDGTWDHGVSAGVSGGQAGQCEGRARLAEGAEALDSTHDAGHRDQRCGISYPLVSRGGTSWLGVDRPRAGRQPGTARRRPLAGRAGAGATRDGTGTTPDRWRTDAVATLRLRLGAGASSAGRPYGVPPPWAW